MSCFVLGIDPDLHSTAAAIVGTSGVYGMKMFNVPLRYKGVDAVTAMIRVMRYELPAFIRQAQTNIHQIVVEGQQIYSYTKASHDSILKLAQVTGAAAALAQEGFPADIIIPRPKEWKGDVPKHIHQARVLTKMGIPFTKTAGKEPYCIPTSIPGITLPKKSDWKHAVDAIGLAVWGVEKATGVKF